MRALTEGIEQELAFGAGSIVLRDQAAHVVPELVAVSVDVLAFRVDGVYFIQQAIHAEAVQSTSIRFGGTG